MRPVYRRNDTTIFLAGLVDYLAYALLLSDIHCDVIHHTIFARVIENQVSRFQILILNPDALLISKLLIRFGRSLHLIVRDSHQRDAELCVYREAEPRAVCSRLQAGSAPYIRKAKELLRVRHERSAGFLRGSRNLPIFCSDIILRTDLDDRILLQDTLLIKIVLLFIDCLETDQGRAVTSGVIGVFPILRPAILYQLPVRIIDIYFPLLLRTPLPGASEACLRTPFSSTYHFPTN